MAESLNMNAHVVDLGRGEFSLTIRRDVPNNEAGQLRTSLLTDRFAPRKQQVLVLSYFTSAELGILHAAIGEQLMKEASASLNESFAALKAEHDNAKTWDGEGFS